MNETGFVLFLVAEFRIYFAELLVFTTRYFGVFCEVRVQDKPVFLCVRQALFTVKYGLRLKKDFSVIRVIQPDGSTVIDEIHAWFGVRLKRGTTNKFVE